MSPVLRTADESRAGQARLSGMPRLTVPLFLALASGACATAEARPHGGKVATFTVTGTVTATGAYCGGAPPPQELLDSLAKPAPQPGLHLVVRKGKQNSSARPVAEVVTDEHGELTAHLPPGTYCVVREDKRTAPTRSTIEPGGNLACLQARFRTCETIWHVAGADVGRADLAIYNGCSWNDDPCFPDRHIPPPP